MCQSASVGKPSDKDPALIDTMLLLEMVYEVRYKGNIIDLVRWRRFWIASPLILVFLSPIPLSGDIIHLTLLPCG